MIDYRHRAEGPIWKHHRGNLGTVSLPQKNHTQIASESADGMLFVLVKRSLITAHASHFAGGKHAFLCLARALAEDGKMGKKIHL